MGAVITFRIEKPLMMDRWWRWPIRKSMLFAIKLPGYRKDWLSHSIPLILLTSLIVKIVIVKITELFLDIKPYLYHSFWR